MAYILTLNHELPANDWVEKESIDWIQLLPNEKTIIGKDGRYFVNSDPENLVLEFNEKGKAIPVDYDHASEHLKGSTRAAGWLTEMKLDDKGVWGFVEWTPEGRKAVEGREFRFISPAFYHDRQMIIKSFSSVALTNKPNLSNMKALNNQDSSIASSFTDELALALNLEQGSSPQELLLQIKKRQEKDNYQLALNTVEPLISKSYFPPYMRSWLIEACQTMGINKVEALGDCIKDHYEPIVNMTGKPLLAKNATLLKPKDTRRINMLKTLGLTQEDFERYKN